MGVWTNENTLNLRLFSNVVKKKNSVPALEIPKGHIFPSESRFN